MYGHRAIILHDFFNLFALVQGRYSSYPNYLLQYAFACLQFNKESMNLLSKPPFALLAQVKQELQLTTWPTREQTIKLTAVVVLVSVVVGVYLGALDWMLTLLLAQII